MDCPRLNGLGTVYINQKTVYKYTLQRNTFASEMFHLSIEIELNKVIVDAILYCACGPEIYKLKNLVTKNGSSAIS